MTLQPDYIYVCLEMCPYLHIRQLCNLFLLQIICYDVKVLYAV